MRNSIIVFSAAAMWLAACTPEFRPQNTEYEPRMVIYGTLQPDSVATVFLSFTRPLPGEEVPEPDMSVAQVRLFENGVLADSLTHAGGYWFRAAGGFRPTPGNVYHIEATHPMLPRLVTDKDTVPPAPVIERFSTRTDQRPGTPNTIYTSYILFELSGPFQQYHAGHKPTRLPSHITPRLVGVGRSGVECGFGAFELNNAIFEEDDCINSNEYIVGFGYLDHEKDLFTNIELYASICYTNSLAARFHKAAGLYQNFNEGIYATDPFFEPVFLPGFVQGGFGFVGTMNCATVRVEF